MKECEGEKDQGKPSTEIQTFPVSFDIGEIKDNLTIHTNNPSKEQIINQAFRFHSQGNISEATKIYQYFINQGFNDHRIFSNYGTILKNLGKLKEAEISYRKAIEINPDYAEAYYNLGNVLKDLGDFQEAELSSRKAIELKPNFANAHLNLGVILNDIGKFQEAEISYRKAIEFKHDYSEAHYNLGNILKDMGKLKEAEISYRRSIELDPYYTEPFFNLSLLELLKGDYKNGLENYEFRFKKKSPAILHGKTIVKRFDKNTLVKEEKLLVVTEQGLGDTLQYMRYIPYLRKEGFDISFSAQTKLHSLIQESGIDEYPLTPEQSISVSEGQWMPLLSLPKYLKVTPKNPIINEPYISSNNELNQKWKNILSTEKKPIIGINWQGNPNAEKNNLKGRSLPLETFVNIVRNNNCKFLSLQKGEGADQLDHCSFKNVFVQCQSKVDSCWDFHENAAIIHNCDLIITSDTAIAHLAGGMGKLTWLLLHYVPDWRWGLKEDSTFWYPSMKLFRQKERYNWQEVMERVSNQLNTTKWK